MLRPQRSYRTCPVGVCLKDGVAQWLYALKAVIKPLRGDQRQAQNYERQGNADLPSHARPGSLPPGGRLAIVMNVGKRSR